MSITRSRTITREAIRWVIIRSHPDVGLYTGNWLTRKEAIRAHVEAKGVPTLLNGRVNGYRMAGPSTILCDANLEKDIADGWRYWRAKGDRAVKAVITWPEVVAI